MVQPSSTRLRLNATVKGNDVLVRGLAGLTRNERQKVEQQVRARMGRQLHAEQVTTTEGTLVCPLNVTTKHGESAKQAALKHILQIIRQTVAEQRAKRAQKQPEPQQLPVRNTLPKRGKHRPLIA
jgi:hypothetical protein